MEWGGEAIFMIGKSGRHSTFRPSSFAAPMATNVFSPLALSLTPCFSWVANLCSQTGLGTSLKRGVKEMEYKAAALDAYVALAVTFGA